MSEEESKNAQKQEKALEQIDETMRLVLTPEAKNRLNNVGLVNRELYFKAAKTIIYLYNQGRISGKIDEAQLRQLLEKFSEKREIKIKRK